jgi:hypothetical protein
MSLVFEDKISSTYRSAFVSKITSISAKLGIDPNWLMVVMKNESGLKSNIENSIGCVGLIQFCPDKARGSYKTLGGKKVNLQSLKNISAVSQLEYVYMYYKSFAYKMNSVYDVYLATFYPYAIGKKDSYVFGSERSDSWARKVGSQNPAIDMNKDGYITFSDYRAYINKAIAGLNLTGMRTELTQTEKEKNFVKRNLWIFISISVIVLATSAISIVLMKKK